MHKAAWWAVVAVAVTTAATRAEEQTGGEADQWLPSAHTLPWWAALGGDGQERVPAYNSEVEEEAETGPWVAKRQPPHRLGSVVELYRSMARGLDRSLTRGLDPFNGKRVMSPPKKLWSTACNFNPFSFVCWNAGRRGPVMRQRPLQYNQ